ncbi:Aste57867_14406 [Aphanomyces stellatus]|uniref:Aste57867_14406 protein n=1 Tax=Aphanomyces stellatus TaxID=120398 RepID=A0A485L1E5_9STRA|nr:hypothetical protein As57867_014352 [Aphanomyces stellatus]VFT91228.1 Aste57867_14406 [Aphanomyces stellatus]
MLHVCRVAKRLPSLTLKHRSFHVKPLLMRANGSSSVPPLSEGVVEALHDKSIPSQKRLELVQTYFAQDPQVTDPHDAAAMSILLEELLVSRDMTSALTMVELMLRHKVPATSSTVALFTRMFARLLTDDPSQLSTRLRWYLDHHFVLASPVPLPVIYSELVTRGNADLAVELWELCMKATDTKKDFPHHASVDDLAGALIRYQQFQSVLAMYKGQYHHLLRRRPVFMTSAMEAFSGRREYHNVLALHELLGSKGKNVHNPRYKAIVEKAKMHVEVRTGKSD